MLVRTIKFDYLCVELFHIFIRSLCNFNNEEPQLFNDQSCTIILGGERRLQISYPWLRTDDVARLSDIFIRQQGYHSQPDHRLSFTTNFRTFHGTLSNWKTFQKMF